ncbi:hypothetical protein ACJX0J_016422 [Zea mays]
MLLLIELTFVGATTFSNIWKQRELIGLSYLLGNTLGMLENTSGLDVLDFCEGRIKTLLSSFFIEWFYFTTFLSLKVCSYAVMVFASWEVVMHAQHTDLTVMFFQILMHIGRKAKN